MAVSTDIDYSLSQPFTAAICALFIVSEALESESSVILFSLSYKEDI